MIYFIQVGKDGPFKIGYSSNPKKRLKQLQTSWPDELVLREKIKGGRRKEKLIHLELSKYHIRGEWFSRTGVEFYLIQVRSKRGHSQKSKLQNIGSQLFKIAKNKQLHSAHRNQLKRWAKQYYDESHECETEPTIA